MVTCLNHALVWCSSVVVWLWGCSRGPLRLREALWDSFGSGGRGLFRQLLCSSTENRRSQSLTTPTHTPRPCFINICPTYWLVVWVGEGGRVYYVSRHIKNLLYSSCPLISSSYYKLTAYYEVRSKNLSKHITIAICFLNCAYET